MRKNFSNEEKDLRLLYGLNLHIKNSEIYTFTSLAKYEVSTVRYDSPKKLAKITI